MTYRKCVLLNISQFLSNNPELLNSNVEIWIDLDNKHEIEKFLLERRKKFTRILYNVLQNIYDEDLYDREEVSGKAAGVTVMKFKGKLNYRIACREIFNGNKKVVMIYAFIKKSQKNDKKIKTIYEKIGQYEYNF